MQPMFPPKRFDTPPSNWVDAQNDDDEGLDAFRFVLQL